MSHKPIATVLMLAGLVSAPAWAASLAATDPSEPMPEASLLAANPPSSIESWSAGSATLVPLMERTCSPAT